MKMTFYIVVHHPQDQVVSHHASVTLPIHAVVVTVRTVESPVVSVEKGSLLIIMEKLFSGLTVISVGNGSTHLVQNHLKNIYVQPVNSFVALSHFICSSNIMLIPYNCFCNLNN